MIIKAHPSFSREIKYLSKKHISMRQDYATLLASLQDNPQQGSSLGRDCFKIRMAISSKKTGKSGGARVITCVKIENETIHLLSIFDKSEKATITNAELTELLKQLDDE